MEKDDQATHGWRTTLGVVTLWAVIANELAPLESAKCPDECGGQEKANEHGESAGHE